MSIFYRLLAFIMPTPTVNSAVRFLQKAIINLEKAEQSQIDKGVGLDLLIADLQEQKAEAFNEAEAAARIKRNLKGIFD